MDAWVLGGTSGIGWSIVQQLKSRNVTCLTISNDRTVGEGLQHQSQPFGYLDLGNEARTIASTTQSFGEQYGWPRYVFISAGITREELALNTAPDDWNLLARVNLLGIVHFCNLIGQAWRELPDEQLWRRHFIFIGSVNALRPLSSQGAYSVMKAGLHAYAKCLGNDLASAHIRVNVIAPGAIWTPMNETIFSKDTDGTERNQVAKSALVERFGDPNEVAQTAVWLALDSPAFLMATDLVIDGGYMSKR